jgi:hypothetical protein
MITRPNLCGWFESDLGDPQRKDARRKEKVMAKRGNSKASQSVKNFCLNAAAFSKKSRAHKPEEASNLHQKVEVPIGTVTVDNTPLANDETPLARWIKTNMQEKKKLMAAG